MSQAQPGPAAHGPSHERRSRGRAGSSGSTSVVARLSESELAHRSREAYFVPCEFLDRDPQSARGRWSWYGWVGLAMLLVTQAGIVLEQVYPGRWFLVTKLSQWATTFCWWGYILALDALLDWRRGRSLIRRRPREFWKVMLPLSVGFWLVFEVYNVHLGNWVYEGVWTEPGVVGGHLGQFLRAMPGLGPAQAVILTLGMMLAFATIMPGLFLTAELVAWWGIFRRLRILPMRITSRLIYTWIVLGFLCLIVPWLLPTELARYTFGLVWVGFVLVLDPLVYSNGGPALLKDLEQGRLGRIVELYAAGLVCGVLWELWNYWSLAKWHYTLPFPDSVRIFEMPIAGFWGFAPFAWEYYVMYQFAWLLGRRRFETAASSS